MACLYFQYFILVDHDDASIMDIILICDYLYLVVTNSPNNMCSSGAYCLESLYLLVC